LDLLESLAEWAGNVSGRPVTEGKLWKSIRAYRERNVLLGLLADGEARNLARAGDFLPPETHCILLSRYLPAGRQPASATPEEDRGDPLLVLCRRFAAKNAAGGTGFAGAPAAPRKTC
jgi:hypothetical protein